MKDRRLTKLKSVKCKFITADGIIEFRNMPWPLKDCVRFMVETSFNVDDFTSELVYDPDIMRVREYDLQWRRDNDGAWIYKERVR